MEVEVLYIPSFRTVQYNNWETVTQLRWACKAKVHKVPFPYRGSIYCTLMSVTTIPATITSIPYIVSVVVKD